MQYLLAGCYDISITTAFPLVSDEFISICGQPEEKIIL